MSSQIKKLTLLFIGLFILLGVLFLFLWPNSNDVKGKKLYHKDKLHVATLLQLDDPLYENIITPSSLKTELENKENITVYFYSPLCHHCKEETSIIVPLGNEKGVNLYLLNLLEFKEAAKEFNVKGTPTIIHYQDGKEVKRLVGTQDKAAYTQFFHFKS